MKKEIKKLLKKYKLDSSDLKINKYKPDFYLPFLNLFITLGSNKDFKKYCDKNKIELLEIKDQDILFIEKYLKNKLDSHTKLKIKPWGSENLVHVSKDYTMKEITVFKGHKSSLQYHEYKHETIYVVRGMMKFYVGDSEDSLEAMFLPPGSFYVIPVKKVHRMEAVEDCTFIEASTSHLFDVVRLQDAYGR